MNLPQKIIIRDLNNNLAVIGGPGRVVVIDLLSYHSDNQPSIKYVVGFVELQSSPIKIQLRCKRLKSDLPSDHFADIVKSAVAPGSWLLLEDVLYIEEYYDTLRTDYPVITSRKSLEKYNNNEQNVMTNLRAVWDCAIRSLI